MSLVKVLCFTVFLLSHHSFAQNEGDSCIKSNLKGTCIILRNCPAAIQDIRRRINPQICGFTGVDPIVCCVDASAQTERPTSRPTTPRPTPATTPKPRPTSTTEYYIPPVNDYSEDVAGCPPIANTLTSQKIGKKAWDKCIEYQEKYVYPCEESTALIDGMTRGSYCNHDSDGLIIGGTDTTTGEFPHMALLGYGEDLNSVTWGCGGSIISEKFILTAGHCVYSRDLGDITFVRIGLLKRSEKLDPSRVYKVKNIIKHPNYNPPNKYNDIALLETEKEMKLDALTVPACLDIGVGADNTNALATGWGLTKYKGFTSDVLQKVRLTQFTKEECSANFPPERKMKDGYAEKTQMCYGDKKESKDTCQGDSGGPLQVYNKKIHCMYTIVGVTSFGLACGFAGVPAIYTRVAAYTGWIESVVWP